MNKYRIMQVEKEYASGRIETMYIVQKKFLWFWKTENEYEYYGDWSYRKEFKSWEDARKYIDDVLDEKVVEECIK